MTKEEEIKQLCANIRYLRERAGPVSYTHLDVYKRQVNVENAPIQLDASL